MKPSEKEKSLLEKTNNQNEQLATEIKNDIEEIKNEDKQQKSELQEAEKNQELLADVALKKAYAKVNRNIDFENATVARIINSSHVTDFKNEDNVGSIFKKVLIDWNEYNVLDDFGKVFELPFRVIDEVPRLFDLIVTYNSQQSPDYRNKILETSFHTTETLQQASMMFNSQTLTVRNQLRNEVNGKQIWNVNKYEPGTLKIPRFQSAPQSFAQETYGAESRLRAMIDIFLAFDGVIYDYPNKLTPNYINNNELTAVLSSMPIYEKMYPHIYYSIFTATSGWYREALNELARKAQIAIGDTQATIHYAMKMTSYIMTITDQFAAELARLNFLRLQMNQINVPMYQARIEANCFADTIVNANIMSDLTYLSLYQPPEADIKAFIYQTLVSKEQREQICQYLTSLISKLSLFHSRSIDESLPWNSLPTVSSGQFVNQALKTTLSNAGSLNIENFLILETFSNFFTFNFDITNAATESNCIFTLLAMVVCAWTFPNVFQKSIGSIGLGAMHCFSRLSNSWNSFVIKYGSIVDINDNKTASGTRQMTYDELLAGCTYSIFSKNVGRGQNVTELEKLIAEFRDLCRPNRTPVYLNRKKAASYPYIRSDYKSTLSWPPMDINELRNQVVTNWASKLKQAISFAEKLIQLKYGKNAPSASVTTPKNYLQSLFNQMSINFSSAGSLFQHQCARVQSMLKNSFGFVYDEFSPGSVPDFRYPQPIVMSTVDEKQALPIIPIQVDQMNIFTPLYYVLTTSGAVDRPVNVAILDTKESFYDIVRDNYIQGHILDQMFVSYTLKARRLNLALWIGRALRSPNDESNPLKYFAREFRHYLSMSNWVPLMKLIFESLKLDWEIYFLNVPRGTPDSRGFDTRALSQTLYRRSREGAIPDTKNNDKSELFGAPFLHPDEKDSAPFKVISKMMFNEGDQPTAVIPKGDGFILARFYVDDLKPEFNIDDTWVLVGKDRWKLSYEKAAGVFGIKPVLSIILSDGSEDLYCLPHIKSNECFLLEVDWMSDIPIEMRSFVAQAIYEGKLGIYCKNQPITAEKIIDIGDRKIDPSRNLYVEKILEILSLPTNAILQHEFVNTKYASNFIGNAGLVPSYVQWIVPLQDLDRTLHAALFSYETRLPNTKLPTIEEVEFGSLSNECINFSSRGVPKIELGCVNWNNALPVINKKSLQTEVKVVYQPRVDFFGASFI